LISREAFEADLGPAARPERGGELLIALTGEGVLVTFFTSLSGDGVAATLRGLFEDLAMDFAGDAGDLGGEGGGGGRAAERLLLELTDESLLADAAAALRGGMAKIVNQGQGSEYVGRNKQRLNVNDAAAVSSSPRDVFMIRTILALQRPTSRGRSRLRGGAHGHAVITKIEKSLSDELSLPLPKLGPQATN
jgi:hypothetical protein